MRRTLSTAIGLTIFVIIVCFPGCKKPGLKPVRVVAELKIGESQDVRLSNGDIVKLSLIDIIEVRDSLRNAIRAAYIKVSVDGEDITLSSGNYNLPVVAGKVQIDCPAIKNYFSNTESREKFEWDAVFRLWPKGSAYINPGTFVYPIRQRLFANMTQSGHEPTYVDWGENPEIKNIYYHQGHDIGGAERMDEIVSATDGLIISVNNTILKGYDSIPVYAHPDAVNVLDDRGWLIEYVHLDSTYPTIKLGERIKMGQKIGLIGKQGSSGGWVHLHFEIVTKDLPSRKWLTEDAYVYAWESYTKQYNPQIIAVARPHQFVWTGQEATIDGSKSKSFAGRIVSYEWIFTDGTTAVGPVQKKIYEKPGEYSEILKVTDSSGNVDYDFAVVQVSDRKNPENSFPTIQPAYHPTLDIKPGMPVTFLVRTFNSGVGHEVWNYGDGTLQDTVKSETVNRKESTKGKFAETTHSFSKPGHYIVTVERSNEYGFNAIAHLHIVVDE
jgi:murein DD-endopeptidase MepM/ murein hydrolase activator NlpD